MRFYSGFLTVLTCCFPVKLVLCADDFETKHDHHDKHAKNPSGYGGAMSTALESPYSASYPYPGGYPYDDTYAFMPYYYPVPDPLPPPPPKYNEGGYGEDEEEDEEEEETTTESPPPTTTLAPFTLADVKVPAPFLRIEYMISFTFFGALYGLGFLVLFQSLCVPAAKLAVYVVYIALLKLGVVDPVTLEQALEQLPPT